MINEERVKRIYKIALYEKKEEKEKQLLEQYFRSDYIGKELIKSFFSGSLAYVAIIVLWLMGNWSELLRQINTLEIIDTVGDIVVMYIIFVFAYLVVTGVVYATRYKESKEKRDTYLKHVKRLYQMYEREEKLKL